MLCHQTEFDGRWARFARGGFRGGSKFVGGDRNSSCRSRRRRGRQRRDGAKQGCTQRSGNSQTLPKAMFSETWHVLQQEMDARRLEFLHVVALNWARAFVRLRPSSKVFNASSPPPEMVLQLDSNIVTHGVRPARQALLVNTQCRCIGLGSGWQFQSFWSRLSICKKPKLA